MTEEIKDEPAAAKPALTGVAVIADVIRRLPAGPGVYRMIDARGHVLYVGKARSLKKRVQSYTRIAGQPGRIARVIMATASMEFVSTRTETEALLLEANLIKRLRPRFNVLLRDDKSFPYILITEDHPVPAIVKHRGARSRKGTYFGPFASAGAVGRTINALQRAFLIRTCSDSFYESRTRPCLLYQIKRCSAPCTGVVSHADYAVLVDEAKGFLSGKSQAVRTEMQRAMEAAAERLDFEAAATYRDRLAALSHVQSHQGINPKTVDEADVFAVHQDGGSTCIQVFFFRTGQNWGNRAYFPRADKALEPGQVLGEFLAQFYDDKPAPKLILLSHDIEERTLLEEALGEKSGRKVAVMVPQRGEKRELVEHALANARDALGREMAVSATQQTLLAGVAERFGLAEPPRRIEVFDNSHIMGTNPVGAVIVAGPDGFI
ncbi:MAG: excinuclease ABC subunit UvrC, partial [Bauldia sp.]